MDARPPHTGRHSTSKARRLFVGWVLFAALLITMGLGGAGLSLSKAPAEATQVQPTVVIARCAAGEGPKLTLAAWACGVHDLAIAALWQRLAGLAALGRARGAGAGAVAGAAGFQRPGPAGSLVG